MNIQRYLLPVSIAAAIHVAFLIIPAGERPIKFIEVLLTPPAPPNPPEPVTPPEDKADTTVPVTPLAGGPTPPELEEPVTAKPAEVAIPMDPRPVNPATTTRFIHQTIGPGDIDPLGSGNFSKGIYSLDALDRVPNAKVQIAPEYPATLRHSGTSGFVKVQFDVDPSGRVTEARVLESSHREFEEPALRAVRKWQFEPGKRNGKAVPFRIMVPIEFGMEKD